MIRAGTYIINTLAAGAVALTAITAGTAPAEARDKRALGVIAGLAAGALIAGAVEQSQRNGQPLFRTNPAPRQTYINPPQQSFIGNSGVSDWQGDGGWQAQEAYDNGQNFRYREERGGPRLPENCAIEVGNGNYPSVYYAEDCLRRAGFRARLPQYCAQSVRSQAFQGRVYEADCLRNAGYRVARW